MRTNIEYKENKRKICPCSPYVVPWTQSHPRHGCRSGTRRARAEGDSRFPLRKDPAALDRLRAAIRRIEGAGPAWSDGGAAVLPLGIGEIDAHLPWGGLPAGALHEIVAADAAMASAFSAYLASLSGNGPGALVRGRAHPRCRRVASAGIEALRPRARAAGLRPDRERCRNAVGNGRRASLRHPRRGGRHARRGLPDREPETPARRRGERG